MKDTILRQAHEFVDHVLETNGGVFDIHINFCNIHVKLKSGYQQKCWVSSKNKRISTRTTGRDMQYPAACRGVKRFFYFPSNCWYYEFMLLFCNLQASVASAFRFLPFRPLRFLTGGVYFGRLSAFLLFSQALSPDFPLDATRVQSYRSSSSLQWRWWQCPTGKIFGWYHSSMGITTNEDQRSKV